MKGNVHMTRNSVPLRRNRRPRRDGATLVAMVLLLVIVLGTAAFAVDVGMMFVARAQMQAAVDSGAIAASLKLKADPTNLDAAIAAAEEYIQYNRVGWQETVVSESITVTVGQWDEETRVFTATNDNPDAVKVHGQQDGEKFMFGGVFGKSVFNVPAEAIATGSGSALDIMLVLDLSGSMGSHGRIEALRAAAPIFVNTIEEYGGDDHIGVMGLSANPDSYDPIEEGHFGVEYNSSLHATADHHVGVLEADLTDDFNDIRDNVLSTDNLDDGKYTGWTGTGAALGDAAHYLENSTEARDEAKKIIVLMSDGHANRPTGNGSGYATSYATYAASLDIKVYTISLGDGADLTMMQSIADSTGGKHFEAPGSSEAVLAPLLANAFKNVAEDIKRTQLVQ